MELHPQAQLVAAAGCEAEELPVGPDGSVWGRPSRWRPILAGQAGPCPTGGPAISSPGTRSASGGAALTGLPGSAGLRDRRRPPPEMMGKVGACRRRPEWQRKVAGLPPALRRAAARRRKRHRAGGADWWSSRVNRQKQVQRAPPAADAENGSGGRRLCRRTAVLATCCNGYRPCAKLRLDANGGWIGRLQTSGPAILAGEPR